MKTVRIFEKNEEVLIRCTIDKVAMDEDGNVIYQVKNNDTGKDLGIWFKDDKLIPLKAPDPIVHKPTNGLEVFTEPIIEG